MSIKNVVSSDLPNVTTYDGNGHITGFNVTGNVSGGNLIATGTILAATNGTGGTAFSASSGAVNGVALAMPQNSALRDSTNGSSIMYFDASTGGAANGEFQWRSSNAYTQLARLTSDGFENLKVASWGAIPQQWFRGSLTADLTLANSDNLINWTNNNDPQGWWNGSNQRLTPGRAGWYQISFKTTLLASATAGTGQINTQVRINDTNNSIAVATNNEFNAQTIANTCMLYMTDTDYFTFTVYTSVNGQSMQGTRQGSMVSVVWISE